MWLPGGLTGGPTDYLARRPQAVHVDEGLERRLGRQRQLRDARLPKGVCPQLLQGKAGIGDASGRERRKHGGRQ
jgi:hypothetical protein